MKTSNGMKKYILFSIIVLAALWVLSSNVVYAANWYVDSSVGSPGNGQSWASAWKSFSDINGLSPGDTVYISGGPTGSSKTYTVSSVTPFSGNPGSPISYRIGQESSHKGTAIFDTTGDAFVDKANVIVSGDAGDGQMHFRFRNGWRPLNSDGNNIKISYVDCGEKGAGFWNNGGTNIEIDHINFRKVNGGDDMFVYLSPNSGTWDANKIHDCTVELIRTDSGTGDDGIKGGGSGVSVYNNVFIGYLDNDYSGGQHQDGIQYLGGTYHKIYNNYFKDLANYPIFCEAYYGGFSHARIFNNVIVITSSAIQGSAPPQAIVMGPGGGATGNYYYNTYGTWPNIDDVVIANNLIADYGTHICVALENDPGQHSVFSNCMVANNICFNSGGSIIENGVTTSNNIQTSGGSHFVSYAPLSASNDFHLLSSDTTFNDQGTSMSSYFTIDKDGVTRPYGSAWDIGPYEYTGSTPPSDTTPPSIPANLSATAISSSQINLSWTASTDNVGVTGYRIYRAGTQIGTSASNSYSNTGLFANTTYSYTVSAYDAAGNVSAQSSSASATTQTPSANIEAESGTLVPPMQIVSDSSASGNAYIQTTVTEQGSATYSFSIASAGVYKIVARVYVPDGASDSFYFKVDNSTEEVWDLNPAGAAIEFNVWREDKVTKRGTGTFDYPQYDPYIVNLTAGNHTLTFRGRETNARLDYFYLIKVIDTTPPAAPSGVTVS